MAENPQNPLLHIDGCDQQILANYRPQDMDKLTTLQALHITTNNKVPIPMPLCTHHYHQIYDASQSHCATCDTFLINWKINK